MSAFSGLLFASFAGFLGVAFLGSGFFGAAFFGAAFAGAAFLGAAFAGFFGAAFLGFGADAFPAFFGADFFGAAFFGADFFDAAFFGADFFTATLPEAFLEPAFAFVFLAAMRPISAPPRLPPALIGPFLRPARAKWARESLMAPAPPFEQQRRGLATRPRAYAHPTPATFPSSTPNPPPAPLLKDNDEKRRAPPSDPALQTPPFRRSLSPSDATPSDAA
jgi:hypothetical protein